MSGKPPTKEELRKYIEGSNDVIGWFGEHRVNIKVLEFQEATMGLMRALRVRAYMRVFPSPRFTEDDFIAMKTDMKLSHMLFPASDNTVSTLREMMLKPVPLAANIRSYFAANPESVGLFATLTFPSIFGFFAVPHLLENAAKVIESLLEAHPTKLTELMVVAFFDNDLRFMERLIDVCEQNLAKIPIKSMPFRHFECFVNALQVAVRLLDKYRLNVAMLLARVDHRVFIDVFVRQLFLKTVRERIPNMSLISALESIGVHPYSVAGNLIVQTLTEPALTGEMELACIGRFKRAELRLVYVPLAIYEVRMITDIMGKTIRMDYVTNPDERASFERLLSRSCTVLFRVYPEIATPERSRPLNILPFGRHAVCECEPEQFVNNYTALVKAAAKENVVDILAFYDSVRVVSSLNSEEMENYVLMKVTNELYDKMTAFDEFLDMKQAILYYEKCTADVEISTSYIKNWIALQKEFEKDRDMKLRRSVQQCDVSKRKGFSNVARIVSEHIILGDEPLASKFDGPRNLLVTALRLPVGPRIARVAIVVESFMKTFGDDSEAVLMCFPRNMKYELAEALVLYTVCFKTLLPPASEFDETLFNCWSMIYGELIEHKNRLRNVISNFLSQYPDLPFK